MTRAAMRRDLIELVVLSAGFGLFAAHAIWRTAYFAPDEPWWVYALMGNLMVMQAVGTVVRFRRILSTVAADEASPVRPAA